VRKDPEEEMNRTDPTDPTDPTDDASDPTDPSDTVALPITDVLDLHSFRPAEVPDLVRDYLDAAYEMGLRHLRIIHGKGIGVRLRDLRIIHGKGIGVQRQTVRTLLERDPRVEAFGDAPLGAGSWGATWVRLR
jgi:DNA-nicking Smr family endonuclease